MIYETMHDQSFKIDITATIDRRELFGWIEMSGPIY